MKWPTTKEQHAYMKGRQEQNIARSKANPNEQWMAEHLSSTEIKWTRQAQWGYRIFDFWNHRLGVAIEVDGTSHDAVYDEFRDKANMTKSGILVLRVRNRNEADALEALEAIKLAETWNTRRTALGLKPMYNGGETHGAK
jgi:very-short-patch-repair endonuclease